MVLYVYCWTGDTLFYYDTNTLSSFILWQNSNSSLFQSLSSSMGLNSDTEELYILRGDRESFFVFDLRSNQMKTNYKAPIFAHRYAPSGYNKETFCVFGYNDNVAAIDCIETKQLTHNTSWFTVDFFPNNIMLSNPIGIPISKKSFYILGGKTKNEFGKQIITKSVFLFHFGSFELTLQHSYIFSF